MRIVIAHGGSDLRGMPFAFPWIVGPNLLSSNLHYGLAATWTVLFIDPLAQNLLVRLAVLLGVFGSSSSTDMYSIFQTHHRSRK